jgi:hypothetical protein
VIQEAPPARVIQKQSPQAQVSSQEEEIEIPAFIRKKMI